VRERGQQQVVGDRLGDDAAAGRQHHRARPLGELAQGIHRVREQAAKGLAQARMPDSDNALREIRAVLMSREPLYAACSRTRWMCSSGRALSQTVKNEDSSRS
jgi:hypothetical protein